MNSLFSKDNIRIAIIGAGYYGLHIASQLKTLGFNVQVFDKEDEVMTHASGKNQYRLHLGFHYARNFRTRQQSRDGFYRFIERYGFLTKPIENNYYIVPKDDSLIDFKTYKLIMMASGLDFSEVSPPKHISHPCGCIQTDERVLLIADARVYFKAALGEHIHLGEKISVIQQDNLALVNDREYDYVIDCTWGHLETDSDFFYESTILFYYRLKIDNFRSAFTFVDGPLCSLYPTEDPNIYTLSSVVYTPLCTSSNRQQVIQNIKSVSTHDLSIRRLEMERQLIKYMPSFLDAFEYVGPQFSIKTKPVGSDDDRSCYVKKSGKVIKVLSGKIDNIFYAASEVLSQIQV